MKNGLEVKSVDFGELKGISDQEFRDSTGLTSVWDGFVDGASVKLVLANNSEELKKAYIYTVSIADIPSSPEWSWGREVEIKPGDQEEVSYLVPMHVISSSDYRDYTGPLRYAVEVSVSEVDKWNEIILKRIKYYDIPARVSADELAEDRFDISKALDELEKTTVLHDLHIGGNPREGLKAIEAKLLNFGEKTQYIAIDTRAERKRGGYQTQFFYEVGAKEEIPVAIGSFIPEKCPPGMDYLRIRAVSVPEQVFRNQKGRSSLLGDGFEQTLIAKLDFYFKENE